MSEQVSYSPTYESYTPPAPHIPTLWDRALTRARDEIAAAGGLGATRNLLADHSNSVSWLSTAQREDALKSAMHNTLADLTVQHASLQSHKAGQAALRLSSMVSAIERVPQLAAMVNLGAELDKIKSEADNLLQLAQSNSSHNLAARATQAEQQLRYLSARAHRHLATAEGELLQELVGGTLRDLGYEVNTKATSVRATRGTTCIWASVNERGGLNLDVSGFSGRTCQTEIKALENMMEQHGLILKRTSAVMHQNVKGGDLAQSLANAFDARTTTSTAPVWGQPVGKSQPNTSTVSAKTLLRT